MPLYGRHVLRMVKGNHRSLLLAEVPNLGLRVAFITHADLSGHFGVPGQGNDDLLFGGTAAEIKDRFIGFEIPNHGQASIVRRS
jgi:hypothetical protein